LPNLENRTEKAERFKAMTKEALKAEIAALNKVVNKVGHKYGGKILMKIAELMRKLNGLGQKEPHAKF